MINELFKSILPMSICVLGYFYQIWCHQVNFLSILTCVLKFISCPQHFPLMILTWANNTFDKSFQHLLETYQINSFEQGWLLLYHYNTMINLIMELIKTKWWIDCKSLQIHYELIVYWLHFYYKMIAYFWDKFWDQFCNPFLFHIWTIWTWM